MPLVAVALVAITALMYGPPIRHDGWIYDDWSVSSEMLEQPDHSWSGYYDACHAADSASRPGACAHHATALWLFGRHVARYHAAATLIVFLTALLLFLLLRRCRLPPWAAAATAALFIVFPGSDATRLWPTGDNLAWALLLWVVGALAGLSALERRGRRAVPLHALSIVFLLGSMLTYDGMIPVVAMTGGLYLASLQDRRALMLAIVDLVIAAGYGLWRLVLAAIPGAEEFTVHRTLGQDVKREAHLLNGGWITFKTLFLPGGWVGIALLIGAAAVIVAALVQRPAARRAITAWLAIAGGSALFAAISVSAYITANDLYVPGPYSLFNRLNVAAAPAYCLLFVALLAALGLALQALAPAPRGARAAAIGALVPTIALAAIVGIHQYSYSRATQRSYALAWAAEGRAMYNIRAAIARIPGSRADIVSFGHPIWEQRFIPVFAARWDLRGAIVDETHDRPPVATPFFPGMGCGPSGLMNGPALLVPYTGPDPLWFVDATTGAARHILSQTSCRKAVAQLTPLPFFDPAGTAT